jgi:hypothetical protein
VDSIPDRDQLLAALNMAVKPLVSKKAGNILTG